MELLKCDALLDVPSEVAVCPMCGGKLWVQFDSWTQEEDGTWAADHAEIDCENEPDIESDGWDDWFSWHYSMPYVDWLPIDRIVTHWVMQHYRFDIKD